MMADDHGRKGRLVPAKPAGADPTRYRLDAGTLRLLELVDGERDVVAIAAAMGADLAAVSARLEMLSRAGLVTIAEAAPAAEPAVASEPVPEAAVLEVSESGALAERPAPALLSEVSSSGLDGAIRFERGGDRVTFYFASGRPVGVRSECPRHDLGDMLRAAGKIGEAAHAAYRAAMERGAEHPVSALRQAGVADKTALAALLAWHGGALLEEVSAWPDGTYGIAPGAPVPPRVAKVRIGAGAPAAQVKADWREGPLTAAEEEFIERNASRYLVVNPSAGRQLATMGLGEKEARFVRHLAGKPLQVREALSISTLYRSPTRKLIVGLVESGAFSLHDTNPLGVSAIPVEELIPYAERLERENDFDVLAAHPSSTAGEIAARHESRRAEFDDARFPSAAAEHLAALRALRARVDRAYERLKDPERRREYRRSVYSADQLDYFFELQLRKAEVVLKMRCDAQAALEVAESALELKPGEPEATILAATALLQLGRRADAKRAVQALKAIPARLKPGMDELARKLIG
ncbi:MAG: tetratricopeptide repeat protein [Proteobacteria bacterium]|jgi:tetratricopeptide (TPR) repeat protein|nr:tetratricopeptide repeat protein [Pseudomonadota bacterium]